MTLTDLHFYKNRRVLVTGHTGFKGMWLTLALLRLGAKVTGFALEAPTAGGAEVLKKLGILQEIQDVRGDVRDFAAISQAFLQARPEVAFHLAAQPIVRESYRSPLLTFETNVMGTANFLEAARQTDLVRSLLVVTTDKVYQNREWLWGYRENEPLMGHDPYAASKAAAEMVAASYRQSFFATKGIPLSTARAGNVIGGGDFAPDRIVPDCVRAAMANRPLQVRNPHSIRPYQHVLEPIFAYLLLAARQTEDISLAGAWNVGPDEVDCVTTGKLADIFCKAWSEGASWQDMHEAQQKAPHEAQFLKLDASKIKAKLNWRPRWHIEEAIARTVAWAKCYQAGGDLRTMMEAQIDDFLKNGQGYDEQE